MYMFVIGSHLVEGHIWQCNIYLFYAIYRNAQTHVFIFLYGIDDDDQHAYTKNIERQPLEMLHMFSFIKSLHRDWSRFYHKFIVNVSHLDVCPNMCEQKLNKTQFRLLRLQANIQWRVGNPSNYILDQTRRDIGYIHQETVH